MRSQSQVQGKGVYSGAWLALWKKKKWLRKEVFYLTTHSTHFIYGYIASDIWLRTILIVRKETHCRHIGYSFRLTARVLLYAPSHRQDSTYHGLCYTSRGALAGTRNSSMGPPHEGSIRRPIASWANALTTELHLAPKWLRMQYQSKSSDLRRKLSRNGLFSMSKRGKETALSQNSQRSSVARDGDRKSTCVWGVFGKRRQKGSPT